MGNNKEQGDNAAVDTQAVGGESVDGAFMGSQGDMILTDFDFDGSGTYVTSIVTLDGKTLSLGACAASS